MLQCFLENWQIYASYMHYFEQLLFHEIILPAMDRIGLFKLILVSGLPWLAGHGVPQVNLEGLRGAAPPAALQPHPLPVAGAARDPAGTGAEPAEVAARAGDRASTAGEPQSLWLLQLVRRGPGHGAQPRPAQPAPPQS